MANTTIDWAPGKGGNVRLLGHNWNNGLVVASIAISLLGAFTSTQLFCQARISRYFPGVLVWTLLGSLTFGFCSIWSLHEVAMLAYELDLRIGIDVSLTVLSSFLAVGFTFIALASDTLWDRYKRGRRGDRSKRKGREVRNLSRNSKNSIVMSEGSFEPLLPQSLQAGDDRSLSGEHQAEAATSPFISEQRPSRGSNGDIKFPHENLIDTQLSTRSLPHPDPVHVLLNSPPEILISADMPTADPLRNSDRRRTSEESLEVATESSSNEFTESRDSSPYDDSKTSSFGLGNIMSMRSYRKTTPVFKNAFVATAFFLYTGISTRNVAKGLLWSLAITGMHYVGIRGLIIPLGYVILNPLWVALSGVICWVVCVIGCILIPQIENHLGQQFLFSCVAAAGVAAMHFTGMRAATFYSHALPSEKPGYPDGLAIAIASIAITTCIAANGLLAHSATTSRNKLAEIVWTRRKLWMAIAQKENAEVAASQRSDFIASASHEIRTPLHHLQGYTDLLAREELTEEARLLLYAIQRATKTLSLITNNVLDWSRLDKDGEATCRPVALDVRTVVESIITLLPNHDDEAEAELMVVVAPDVPDFLFLDESYFHRVLMNLLSNAIKFTPSGYILLSIEANGGKLIASVKDTGCGIPPSFLPQLFEPFKQAQTRGRQRGTGLGLSIIKQLLQKMEGTIEVESKYQDEEGVGPERSGSTFTITVPAQTSTPPRHNLSISNTGRKIAIFHGGGQRALKGLTKAWERFDFEVVIAREVSDISSLDLEYIWADLPSLKHNPVLLHRLLVQDMCPVIVPYDNQIALQELPEILQVRHFVPIQKPVIWHTIKREIAESSHLVKTPAITRTVRFDPVVSVLEKPEENANLENPMSEPAVKKPSTKDFTVLLVEDNLINQKLGTKMLRSLGYQVLTAEDGVVAIEMLVHHDRSIDIILMDQSMPRKDGLTATKEIREMEAAGALSRWRPIIAVTAVISKQAQELCKAAGTDDFLAKPLSLGRLEETLARHLGLKGE